MQLSHMYSLSSAGQDPAPLPPPIQGPYLRPPPDPSELALWPRQEQLIICILRFIFPQPHTSHTPQLASFPSPSSGTLFSCCYEYPCLQTVLEASLQHTDVLLCSTELQAGGQDWPWGSSDQASSSYYRPSCSILPFRSSSKSQWQSQLLHFTWSLKTKLIFL